MDIFETLRHRGSLISDGQIENKTPAPLQFSGKGRAFIALNVQLSVSVTAVTTA